MDEMSMTMRALLCGAAAMIAATPATAARNLVKNGDFESTVMTRSQQMSDDHGLQRVNDWSTSGYNFLVFAGRGNDTSADHAMLSNVYGTLSLWGPSNGSNNGFTATSPVGGNYVAADGAFGVDGIRQTITGLTVGRLYDLTFYWAGAQQTNYRGATTEQWFATLGNETHATAIAQNADMGFTGWKQESFRFTARNATDVLTFMAKGTPDGVPPFSLLDGVSLTAAVPEPETWAMMVAGFGVVGLAARRRRRGLAVAAA